MGKLMALFFFLLCMLFPVNYRASNFSSISPALSPKICRREESLALLQFKNSISIGDFINADCGDGKTNTWEEGADCCSWEGVSCDGLTGHVIGLDLSCSMLIGSIRSDNSLFQLSHLQSLNLANNLFQSPIPSEFGLLVKLTHLNLSSSLFSGEIPHEISHLSKLVSLDLGYNLLQVDNYAFQNLIQNLTELRVLDLTGTNMSLVEPKYLLNISSSLRSLGLRYCFLNGELPDDFSRFSLLEELDLSLNDDMTGNFPKFNQYTPLRSLAISNTHLSGTLSDSISSLRYLRSLVASNTHLSGTLPDSIGSLKSLEQLELYNCSLNGSIPASVANLTKLSTLSLASNNIFGPLPFSMFNLTHPTDIDLSHNQIDGHLPNNVSGLAYLVDLDFSYNQLNGKIPSWLFTIPSLRSLDLSNNKFTGCFPIHPLHQPNSVTKLDLSNNKIHGPIQNPFSELANLAILNLSHNSLTGNLEQHAWNNILVLDLSSNLIQGPLPVPPRGTIVFMISRNKLSGQISSSICICSSLSVLDLSDNRLNGAVPRCFGNFSSLGSLDLQNNNLNGSIPDTFANGSNLQYVNLNGNQFERQIPRSLANCSQLEILDLGNNKINDTFPYWLGTLLQLKVLILRSNNFHGVISLPKKNGFIFEELQILDLAHNQFNGTLPTTLLGNLKSVMDMERDQDSKPQYLGDQRYRIGVVDITMKDSQFSMERILTIFKCIDFSNNRFEGEIPEVVCTFKELKVLNFSHNNLTGHIPSSFGNLTELESLDLSSNKLVGQIPQQLAVLTSLEVLNLSYNLLVGSIPGGSQLSTFSNDSYIGNSGLCGFPLSKKCHGEPPPQPQSARPHKEDHSTSWFDWKIVMMGYGSGVVIGLSIGYIVFTTGRPWWFVKMVEKKQDKIVRRVNQRRRGGRKLGNPRDRRVSASRFP